MQLYENKDHEFVCVGALKAALKRMRLRVIGCCSAIDQGPFFRMLLCPYMNVARNGEITCNVSRTKVKAFEARAGARADHSRVALKRLRWTGSEEGDVDRWRFWPTRARMSFRRQRRNALARDKRMAMKSLVNREVKARFPGRALTLCAFRLSFSAACKARR